MWLFWRWMTRWCMKSLSNVKKREARHIQNKDCLERAVLYLWKLDGQRLENVVGIHVLQPRQRMCISFFSGMATTWNSVPSHIAPPESTVVEMIRFIVSRLAECGGTFSARRTMAQRRLTEEILPPSAIGRFCQPDWTKWLVIARNPVEFGSESAHDLWQPQSNETLLCGSATPMI